MSESEPTISFTFPVGEFRILSEEVRDALEGDSNDDEHDALVSVAESLVIHYDPEKAS